jgi:hypothetical protein
VLPPFEWIVRTVRHCLLPYQHPRLGVRNGTEKAPQLGIVVRRRIPSAAYATSGNFVPRLGDPAKFPFATNRVYTPETASPEEMAALHRALHIQRVVVVTPSFYGADNSATLYGNESAAQMHVASRSLMSSPGERSEAMDRAGIRGVRINLATVGQTDPIVARRLLQSLIERVRQLRWHIQMNTNLAVISGIRDQVAASPVNQFGGPQASLGISQAGWV